MNIVMFFVKSNDIPFLVCLIVKNETYENKND